MESENSPHGVNQLYTMFGCLDKAFYFFFILQAFCLDLHKSEKFYLTNYP